MTNVIAPGASASRARGRRASVAAAVAILALTVTATGVGSLGSSLSSQGSVGLSGATHRLSVTEVVGPLTVGARPAGSIRPAIVAPTWINVTHGGGGAALPPVYDASVAYDAVDHETVLFGGCLADQCPSNQTWVFANGAWTNLSLRSGSPPAREDASMDFDANMGGVLLFGGAGVGGVLLNDTWLFRGGFWTNLSYVGGGPAPREGASLAFDPDPEENGSVLYGGCVLSSGFPPAYSCFNDTWVWEGWSGWVALHPTLTGPGVGFASMAFDALDDELVLFGGCTGVFCLGLSNATWTFSSGQWWVAHPTVFPQARAFAGLAYDPTLQEVLLFGGLNASLDVAQDTWSFAHGGWAELSPGTAPSAREAFGLSLDGTGSTVLLVGGVTAGPVENDTWVYAPPLGLGLSGSSPAVETTQPVTFTATVAGGTAPYRALIEFGDGASASLAGSGPTFRATHIYRVAGTFTPSVNVTDADGQTDQVLGSAVDVMHGPSISATAAPAVGEVGKTVSFTTNVTAPGSGSLAFAWTFGDSHVASGANVTHAYDVAGTFLAQVSATDSLGGVANASTFVTVRPALADVVVSFVPAHPSPNTPVRFVANFSGGVGPFDYVWHFGNGNVSSEPSPVETFAKSGTFGVTVTVNDSLGASSPGSGSVVVTTPTTSPASTVLAGAPGWFWGGLGGVLAVGAIGTALMLRARRLRSKN